MKRGCQQNDRNLADGAGDLDVLVAVRAASCPPSGSSPPATNLRPCSFGNEFRAFRRRLAVGEAVISLTPPLLSYWNACSREREEGGCSSRMTVSPTAIPASMLRLSASAVPPCRAAA